MYDLKSVILLVGPTAVGKTSLSLELAKAYHAEIFSCDSRQFYREMSIGTAKPTLQELEQVKHHFINTKSIKENYTVGQYEIDLKIALREYFKTKKVAILVGGSGLFVKALTHGFHAFPTVEPHFREVLNQELKENGLEKLAEELRQKDQIYAGKIDLENPQRVIRALEIIRATGKTFSSYTNPKLEESEFQFLKIGLERPREELYKRINDRVDQMLDQGLIAEVENLKPYKENTALNTVGYKEVFSFLEGEVDFKTMVEEIKKNTRRYAKRQITWFKNQDSFQWFHPENKEDILELVKNTWKM